VRTGAVAFGCGLLFAVGLSISGMTAPAKVVGFLDVTGGWDPSLAFVMAGALGTLFAARAAGLVRAEPTAGPIDARLVGGAAIFGVGWGLSGFCPGPAVASLGAGVTDAALFVPAMLAGMLAYRLIEPVARPAPACG
jgi:hypothetical protein